jgi:hypothetical protein
MVNIMTNQTKILKELYFKSEHINFDANKNKFYLKFYDKIIYKNYKNLLKEFINYFNCVNSMQDFINSKINLLCKMHFDIDEIEDFNEFLKQEFINLK